MTLKKKYSLFAVYNIIILVICLHRRGKLATEVNYMSALGVIRLNTYIILYNWVVSLPTETENVV